MKTFLMLQTQNWKEKHEEEDLCTWEMLRSPGFSEPTSSPSNTDSYMSQNALHSAPVTRRYTLNSHLLFNWDTSKGTNSWLLMSLILDGSCFQLLSFLLSPCGSLTWSQTCVDHVHGAGSWLTAWRSVTTHWYVLTVSWFHHEQHGSHA